MREKIVDYVKDNTSIIERDRLILTLETIEISEILDIERSRVSKILNKEVSEGNLIKIKGKPVRFLYNFIDLDNTVWDSLDELWNGIILYKNHDIKIIHMDAFTQLVGHNGSLEHAINQAKAAILYPPKGIHTLITGPSGVGKTTFAKTMYEYAMDIGQLSKDAKYVYYNCADYAGNSQLLLSFLFGHVKGAFTGADEEKTGLVDTANGGILFLDEIHRLPPEGQEMLFSILDNGTFRRLGQNSFEQNTVDLLLIGATTEDIDESILATFRRRIPNRIHLEGLKNKKLEERFNFIDNFFKYESTKIQNQVIVDKDVIRYFCFYDCVGNIGQLKNDIQMICARAFAESIINDVKQINVGVDHIEMNEEQRIFFAKEKRNSIFSSSSFLDNIGAQIFLNGQNISSKSMNEQVISIDNYHAEQLLYQNILNSYSELTNSNSNFENTDIKKQLEDFFSVELSVSSDSYKLGTIISSEVFNGVTELFNRMYSENNLVFDNQVRYSLALHIESVKVRLKSGRLESTNNISKKYDDRFHLYSIINESLRNNINIGFPLNEVLAICMFLEAVQVSKQKNGIGVLVVMHGDSTGDSMAQVANDLLDCNHARAIDMKLTDSFTDIVKKVVDHVIKEKYTNGLLILVDMGSLLSLDKIVSEKTGAHIKLISSVSTSLVLEATRKSLLPGMNLDELVRQLNKDVAYLEGTKSELVIEALNTEDIHVVDSLRYDSRILELIKDSTNFIDTEKSISLINDLISKTCSHLKLMITDGIYIKIQFHCQSMIERAIRKESLTNPRMSQVLDSHQNIYKIIRKEIKIVENSYSIVITDDELAYLIEIIINLDF